MSQNFFLKQIRILLLSSSIDVRVNKKMEGIRILTVIYKNSIWFLTMLWILKSVSIIKLTSFLVNSQEKLRNFSLIIMLDQLN